MHFSVTNVYIYLSILLLSQNPEIQTFSIMFFGKIFKMLKDRSALCNMTLDTASKGEETTKNILKYHFHGNTISGFKMGFTG